MKLDKVPNRGAPSLKDKNVAKALLAESIGQQIPSGPISDRHGQDARQHLGAMFARTLVLAA